MLLGVGVYPVQFGNKSKNNTMLGVEVDFESMTQKRTWSDRTGNSVLRGGMHLGGIESAARHLVGAMHYFGGHQSL
jgi:hypothetical protein